MIPDHYSRDIVQRCQSLIRALRPVVKQGLPNDEPFGGPLDTTFLLAMATPMIVLPIERLFKPSRPAATLPSDDRHLDPDLASDVADVLGTDCRFADAPFATAGHWSYVPDYPLFNVADGLERPLLERLASAQAHKDAETAPTQRILLDLRNALAHGGIAYLDEKGRQHPGPAAAMLAFAGLQHKKGEPPALNILRISEENFFAFLMAWADWLTESRVASAFNSSSALPLQPQASTP